jgi:hypothetical protein
MCQYGVSNSQAHAVTKLYVFLRPKYNDGGGSALERCFKGAGLGPLRDRYPRLFRNGCRKNGKRPIVLKEFGMFRAVQTYFLCKASRRAALAAHRFVGGGNYVPILSPVTCLARSQVCFIQAIDLVRFRMPTLGAIFAAWHIFQWGEGAERTSNTRLV